MLKISDNYKAVIKDYQKEELNRLGNKEQNIARLQECCKELLSKLAKIQSNGGMVYSIVNAADYGSDLFSLTAKAKNSINDLEPIITEIDSNIDSCVIHNEGRKSIFNTPSNQWQLLNKAFNLDFEITFSPDGKMKVSYDPLMHPQDERQPIGESYYLVVQNWDFELTLNEVENTFNDSVFIKLESSDNSARNTVMIDWAQIKTLDEKSLQLNQNYRAYLYVKLHNTYKREVNNFEDFLSLGSFPFFINKNLQAISQLLLYQQFETFKNKLIYCTNITNNLLNWVVRKKAVNSLISDELVTLLTKNMKEMNELNALTVDCLYQLIRLEWLEK